LCNTTHFFTLALASIPKNPSDAILQAQPIIPPLGFDHCRGSCFGGDLQRYFTIAEKRFQLDPATDSERIQSRTRGKFRSDPFQSAEYFFNRHEYFKSVELGWTTSQNHAYLNNVHLTFWHVDEIEATGNPDGWGVNFSASYWVNECWMPFVRGGYTEDGGSLLEASVSAGVGVNPIRGNDLLGMAVNWGRPNENTFGPDLDDQYTVELFYRYQLTENIAITPDIQWLINPALNPEDDSLFLAGVRGRISF
jgi:porin